MQLSVDGLKALKQSFEQFAESLSVESGGAGYTRRVFQHLPPVLYIALNRLGHNLENNGMETVRPFVRPPLAVVNKWISTGYR